MARHAVAAQRRVDLLVGQPPPVALARQVLPDRCEHLSAEGVQGVRVGALGAAGGGVLLERLGEQNALVVARVELGEAVPVGPPNLGVGLMPDDPVQDRESARLDGVKFDPGDHLRRGEHIERPVRSQDALPFLGDSPQPCEELVAVVPRLVPRLVDGPEVRRVCDDGVDGRRGQVAQHGQRVAVVERHAPVGVLVVGLHDSLRFCAELY